jgi:hypothetical protein
LVALGKLLSALESPMEKRGYGTLDHIEAVEGWRDKMKGTEYFPVDYERKISAVVLGKA